MDTKYYLYKICITNKDYYLRKCCCLWKYFCLNLNQYQSFYPRTVSSLKLCQSEVAEVVQLSSTKASPAVSLYFISSTFLNTSNKNLFDLMFVFKRCLMRCRQNLSEA